MTRSYVWLEPVVSAPVTVTPPETATPPIVVTNPTDRLFGTFSVTKTVTGRSRGSSTRPSRTSSTGECVGRPGRHLPRAAVRHRLAPHAGGHPEPSRSRPGASARSTNRSPACRPCGDAAWSWLDPTFTVDGLPVAETGRSLAFDIPTPQEDEPEPNVAIVVTNAVERTFGAFTVAKTSDPPSGTVVDPGSVITYRLEVASTGAVPVHDVVVTDDLAGVLPVAGVVAGSIVAPPGTTASLDEPGARLVWTVGTVAPGITSTLTYQVRVLPGTGGTTIRNVVTGTGDVPPGTCAAGTAPTGASAVSVQTSQAVSLTKEVIGTPTRDATRGEWTVGYRLVVTNPDATIATTYSLADTLGFAPGFEIRAASIGSSPPGVTLAAPPWNGSTATQLVVDAALPAAAAHTYDLTVRLRVPPDTPVAVLGCTSGPATSGSGLFNSATLTSLGVSTTASACAAVNPIVVITKSWQAGGRTYADGAQPSGYRAQLTIDGVDRPWAAAIVGPAPGSPLTVGERVTLPAGCRNASSGLGSVTVRTAVTSLTLTNQVTCGRPLPRTGFSGAMGLVFGMWSLAAGLALVAATRRRRPAVARGR